MVPAYAVAMQQLYDIPLVISGVFFSDNPHEVIGDHWV
jgi:hypothetical protein